MDIRIIKSEDQYRQYLSEIERLAAMFFGDALQVHIGCAMEPTMFKDYPWLVEVAKRHRVPFVGFTTNGQSLNEEGLARMTRAGLDEITVSLHGVTRETYETLMKGADYDQLHATFALIDAVRTKTESSLRLRVNYTICPDNLAERACGPSPRSRSSSSSPATLPRSRRAR